MANIDKYINQLRDPSTNGQRSRAIIVDACNEINKNGTDAKTLQGHGADYFFSVDELKATFDPYFRRIGLVHNLTKVVDENNEKTILTELYKKETATSASSNSQTIKETNEILAGVKDNETVYHKEFQNVGKNTVIKKVVIEDVKEIVNAKAVLTNVGEIEVRAFVTGNGIDIDYDDKYKPIKNVMRVMFDYTKKTKQANTSAKFDITLPTSNAVWLKLGYSELSDLQEYINN